MKAQPLILFLLMLAAGLLAQETSNVKLITAVDKTKNTLTMSDRGEIKAYNLAMTVEITINGSKAKVSDLAIGMKILNLTLSDAITIRKLEAFRTPDTAQGTDADKDNPTVPAPPPREDKNAFREKLAGTFWTYPWSADKQPKEKCWFSLNADGTATAGWHNMAGSWRVLGDLTVQIRITGHSINGGVAGRLHFNSSLTEAGKGVNRIDPPTQAMLDKVAHGFEPNPRAVATGGNATPPVTSELQQSASEMVRINHNNLVFVTGKDGAGSGFIANMGGTNYLVTNAHVTALINGASFKALDGTVVQGGAATIAVGEDVFRMAMPAGGKPLEIMQGVDENAAIGDAVVVLGNAEGQNVINTIIGKITGIGPDRVEVDAPFVHGNSGSPIIHIKSGKVIGIATFAFIKKYDTTTSERLRAPAVRRFGYRLDSVKNWQPVSWPLFYTQAGEMKNIDALTRDLMALFLDLHLNKGNVTKGQHTNPAIKTRLDRWLDERSRSTSGTKLPDQNFLSFLKSVCKSDVTAASKHMTYDFFQRDLASQQQYRDELAKAFDEMIKTSLW
jgi:hypothetical protein